MFSGRAVASPLLLVDDDFAMVRSVVEDWRLPLDMEKRRLEKEEDIANAAPGDVGMKDELQRGTMEKISRLLNFIAVVWWSWEIGRAHV